MTENATDVVQIVDGKVAVRWRRTTAAVITAKHEALGVQVPSTLVEVDADTVSPGMLYDAETETFASPPPPAPTADDVRAHASQLMQAMFGARDAAHLELIISNANREAIRLLRIGAENWTAAQATRAAELEAADAAVEAIRAASNALEAADPIPTDFKDPGYWP